MIDQILPLILPNFYLLLRINNNSCYDGHRLAIKLKKRILKYRLTCRVINENMDKAISQFPELSYLLFVDKVNLYHAIQDKRDKRIEIEPFLRDFHPRFDYTENEAKTHRLLWEPISLALAKILTMPRGIALTKTIFICAANADKLFPLIIKHLKQMRKTNASLYIPFEIIEIGDCGNDHDFYLEDEVVLEFFHLMKELSQGKCNLGNSLCCSKCHSVLENPKWQLGFFSQDPLQVPCTVCNANINTGIICSKCTNPCYCYDPSYFYNGDDWREEGCGSLICDDCMITNEGKKWTSPKCIEEAKADKLREEAERLREEAEADY